MSAFEPSMRLCVFPLLFTDGALKGCIFAAIVGGRHVVHLHDFLHDFGLAAGDLQRHSGLWILNGRRCQRRSRGEERKVGGR